MSAIEQRRVATNGVELNVAIAGAGRDVLLLHGWPHTWRVWEDVLPLLVAAGCRVLAPDLRGIGGSTAARDGYDAANQAEDMRGLLDALGAKDALVVAFDAGAPVALMLALRHADRVRRLALSESLLGPLPGAEQFLANGPPWWFGFHATRDLPETVLEGRERSYLDFFFDHDGNQGRSVSPALRAAFVEAYRGRERLRCGFEHYRALPTNARQIRDAVARAKLSMPVLAMIGGVVGDAIHRQLHGISDDLRHVVIEGSGHIISLAQPERVANALLEFDRA